MKKRCYLIILLVLSSINGWCYDFSSVSPEGKTVYYNLVNGTAQVTYDNFNRPYSNLSGTLTIPESVTYNGVNYTVTSIGEYAFRWCGISSVNLPNTITSIGDVAFAFSGLTSITIPENVTSIGASAFIECTGLTSITIPENVTSIGTDAFKECTGLTSVVFNAEQCTSAGDSINTGYYYKYPAFYGCNNIADFIIGENVINIPNYLCYRLEGLTNVIVPESVISIGKKAFLGCNGLASISIPSNVLSIGDSAFYKCHGLSSAVIDSRNIGNETFYECSYLTGVSFGNNVESIGQKAFANCTNIRNMHLRRSIPPTIQNNTFLLVPTYTDNHIYVPCNSVSAYRSAAYWNQFASIEEEFPFEFNATSADVTRGIVQVLHSPECDYLQAEVVAYPYNGFHFVRWNDGDTNAHRYIVVVQDTAIQAEFAEGNVDITGVSADNIKIYVSDRRVIVDGIIDEKVRIFDIVGREIHNENLSEGVYLVKIDNHSARKIIVIR